MCQCIEGMCFHFIPPIIGKVVSPAYCKARQPFGEVVMAKVEAGSMVVREYRGRGKPECLAPEVRDELMEAIVRVNLPRPVRSEGV